MNDDLPTPTPNPDESFEAKLKAKFEIAKRYGYFYDALSPKQQKLYLLAQIDPGMEAHIAVLRKNIDQLVSEHPDDLKTINTAMKALTKLQAMNLEIRKEHPLPPPPARQPET